MLKFVVSLCLIAFAVASPTRDATLNVEISGRIVGGSTASSGQFPYQVSLRTIENVHFCGATMFSTRWSVTAAQCMTLRNPANTIAVFGALTRLAGGTSHSVSRIVSHPAYNAANLANDIALVETATAVAITASVAPADLASAFVGGGIAVIASGWGQTSQTSGSLASTLQFLNTQTITNADCRSRFSVVNANRVFDNTVCTFTRDGQGVCMGDIGGPLANGNTVVGIISWGIPCATGSPDVYARISSHRTWISSVTG